MRAAPGGDDEASLLAMTTLTPPVFGPPPRRNEIVAPYNSYVVLPRFGMVSVSVDPLRLAVATFCSLCAPSPP